MARSDRVGWGPQMDEDTPTNVLAFSTPVGSFEKDVNREEITYDETVGNRAPSAQEYGGKVYPLTMTGAARPRSFGSILSHFFGAPTTAPATATVGETVRDHTYDPLVASIVPTSFWAKNDMSNVRGSSGPLLDKYEGAIGNTLEINAAVNAYMTYSAGYVAKSHDPSPIEPAFTQEGARPWPYHEIAIQLALAGQPLAAIKSKEWGFSFSNNLVSDEYVLGQVDVDSIPLGDITGQVTFRPTRDVSAHNRRALAEVPEDLTIKLIATSKRPIVGTPFFNTFELELHRIQTITAPVNIGAGDTLRDVEVTCRYVFDETQGKLLTAMLRNQYDGADYKRRIVA